MQNLLDIQNALRSAPDQQLMGLMQGSNPMVPQWAVASELNNRKEMRSEQTRQEGLGQPTVIAQLTGNAMPTPAPAPQTNVAGMPQGVASGMAQSIAPKTNVAQNTGIASVAPNANAAAPAPVATMASGGVLKMQDGGDPAEKTYTFIYPEGMDKPSFDLEISDSGAYNSVVKAIRELGGTIIEKDTGRVMQSDTAKKILQESSDIAEADARVSEYVPSASDVYGKDSGRFKSENATPENYGVSAGLPPVGGVMSSSPTGSRGGNTDSSLLGSPVNEFSGVPLSSISTPEGLATLNAAGDADMRDEIAVADSTVPIVIDATKPMPNVDEFFQKRLDEEADLSRDNSRGSNMGPSRYERLTSPKIGMSAGEANSQILRENQYRVPDELAAQSLNSPEGLRQIADRAKIDQILNGGRQGMSFNANLESPKLDKNVARAMRLKAKEDEMNSLRLQARSIDQRSGLERLEAENEKNLPEAMKNQLRINSYARAGKTAAEIADLLGVSAGKVLDVAAGTLSAGLLETTALGADIMSAYQAGVMGNTDSGMFYANVADKIKQFSDKTFSGDNKLPRMSTALGIPTNAEAAAAATAEQVRATNAKINAMPDDSSMFAERSPTEYTPAGLAAIQARKDELNRDRGPADRENDTVGILEGLQSVADARNRTRFSGSPYDVSGTQPRGRLPTDSGEELKIKNERTGPIPKLAPLTNVDTSAGEPVLDTTPVDGAVVKTRQGFPLEYNEDINAWMLSNIPVDGEKTTEPKDEDVKAIEAGTEAAALVAEYFEPSGQFGDYENATSLDTSGKVVSAQDNSGKSTFVLNNARAEAKADGTFNSAYHDMSLPAPEGIATVNTAASEDNPNNAYGVSKELAQYLPDMPKFLSDPVGLLASLDSNLANNKNLSEEEIQALTTQRDVLAGAIQTGEYIDGAIGDAAALIGRIAMKAGRFGNTLVETFYPKMGAENLELIKRNEEFLDGLAEKGAFTEAVPAGEVVGEVVGDGLDRTVYPQSDSALSLTAAGTRPKLRPTASSTSGGASGTSTGGAGVSAALSAGASAGSKSGSAGGYQDRLAGILDRMDAKKDEDKWLSIADMGLRLTASQNPNFLSAVGESGLGALQGYRQQQGANQKQEIGILSKLGDFDMAERTLQARTAIANASAAGRGSLTAGQNLADLRGQMQALEYRRPGKDATPTEVKQYAAEVNRVQSQINALRGEAPPEQVVRAPDADASDKVSFVDRIFG